MNFKYCDKVLELTKQNIEKIFENWRQYSKSDRWNQPRGHVASHTTFWDYFIISSMFRNNSRSDRDNPFMTALMVLILLPIIVALIPPAIFSLAILVTGTICAISLPFTFVMDCAENLGRWLSRSTHKNTPKQNIPTSPDASVPSTLSHQPNDNPGFHPRYNSLAEEDIPMAQEVHKATIVPPPPPVKNNRPGLTT